ncbi:MAG: hypothetical protein ABJF50_21460 [Paracoccaceae bacterium]
MTHLTRRDATALILASTGSLLLPSVAKAETAESLARKLGDALNGRLTPNCGGRFSTVKFKLEGTRKDVIMRSVLRLDWPPGARTRNFRSTGGSQQEAIVKMFHDALKEFGGAWPDCVRV